MSSVGGDDDSVEALQATLAELQGVWERLQARQSQAPVVDVSAPLKSHLRRLFSGDMLWCEAGDDGTPVVTLKVEGDADRITAAFVVAELEAIEHEDQVVGEQVMVCAHCGGDIPSEDASESQGKRYHRDCLAHQSVCRSCAVPLRGAPSKDKMYCADHAPSTASVCAGCGEALTRQVVAALDRKWHSACFVCAECKQPFQGGIFFKIEGKPYCAEHAGDDDSEGDDETEEETDVDE